MSSSNSKKGFKRKQLTKCFSNTIEKREDPSPPPYVNETEDQKCFRELGEWLDMGYAAYLKNNPIVKAIGPYPFRGTHK